MPRLEKGPCGIPCTSEFYRIRSQPTGGTLPCTTAEVYLLLMEQHTACRHVDRGAACMRRSRVCCRGIAPTHDHGVLIRDRLTRRTLSERFLCAPEDAYGSGRAHQKGCVTTPPRASSDTPGGGKWLDSENCRLGRIFAAFNQAMRDLPACLRHSHLPSPRYPPTRFHLLPSTWLEFSPPFLRATTSGSRGGVALRKIPPKLWQFPTNFLPTSVPSGSFRSRVTFRPPFPTTP